MRRFLENVTGGGGGWGGGAEAMFSLHLIGTFFDFYL